MKTCLLSYTLDELSSLMLEWGEKKFRATQLFEWIWRQRADSFEQMTNLTPTLRERLETEFTLRPLSVVERNESPGGTCKFLSRMEEDGQLVESVIIPAATGQDGEKSKRITLCVSSQVGCAFGCKFCASGLLGLTRNLTAAEIVGQILAAEEITQARVDNLVFMGMGEPLANMDNLERSLELIMDQRALGIGARHITISTSGNVPGLKRLAKFGKPIRLAVSLHGARDEVREQIMPVNRKWPLGQLSAALEEWQQSSKHMITLEYILIAGVNDGFNEVPPLAALAHKLRAKINVIPYNIVEGLPWERPTEAHCKAFCARLINQKIKVTMRYEKGHDINAACGQLRLRKTTEES